MERHVFEISWGSLWRVLFFVVFVTVLFLGKGILLGLFLALVISAGLDVIVNFLERRGIPRTLGVIAVFVIGALLLIFIAYRVVPMVLIDLNSIVAGVNKSAAAKWFGPLINFQKSGGVDSFVDKLSSQLFSGTVSPFATLSDLFGGFGLAVAVLVSSFYLSLSHDGIERFIRAVMPYAYEDATLRIYNRSRRKIGYWFRTQIALTLLMGLSTWGALTILGVKHALLIGIVAGVFELVPFVGPILSGALAVLAAYGTAPTLAFYTFVVFLILHQIEANIVVPLLTKRVVGLHPVIVISALLIGIEIGGILGAIAAVPAAAVFQEIIEEWSKTRRGVSNGEG